MGIAGSGKTTIGRALAERAGWPFYDADDYHSAGNIARMTKGEPLTDADRDSWLTALSNLIATLDASGGPAVLACSALRDRYRDRLESASPRGLVRFVYLHVSREVAEARMRARLGHYMPASLVGSQIETLEQPENALVLDGTLPIATLVDRILVALNGPPQASH